MHSLLKFTLVAVSHRFLSLTTRRLDSLPADSTLAWLSMLQATRCIHAVEVVSATLCVV